MGGVIVTEVSGTAIPQGSITPFPYMKKTGGLGVAVPQKKTVLEWRDKVSNAVLDVIQEGDFFEQYEPVSVEVLFVFERPKSSKRKYPAVKKADLDKLIRSLLDSLSGVCIYDDCQVINIRAFKRYGAEAKTCILIKPIECDAKLEDYYKI